MKLITWNIWGGRRLSDVISYLKNQPADIICLQEVDVREKNGKEINSAEEIARELSMEYFYCKAFRTDRHTPVYDLGDAILSKFPVLENSCHFLSDLSEYQKNSATEPRTAVVAKIQTPKGIFTVISTHLGYSDGFSESQLRDKQTEKLTKLFENEKTILAGDFNSLPGSRVLKRVEEFLVSTDKNLNEISYTDQKIDGNPKYRIDYIFASPDVPTTNFMVHSDATGSDHFPLSIEVE